MEGLNTWTVGGCSIYVRQLVQHNGTLPKLRPRTRAGGGGDDTPGCYVTGFVCSILE